MQVHHGDREVLLGRALRARRRPGGRNGEGGARSRWPTAPFHTLARQVPELICGMNQALVDGLLRGLGNRSVQAVLVPTEGACCVELR